MLLSILLFLGPEDAILIAVVVLLLFGGKKLPEVMKSVGKGVKSFKDEMNGLEHDLKSPDKPDAPKNKEEIPPVGNPQAKASE